eukprot:CAMPEP_0197725906 /NCGR_PEP_ID=MMETSP1434-20131217/11933_1 /TAXON_ID=265543 /ORGANISM="Minutocellus polymorphus, Strain CCMP3303" /LENGTH=159 /DNA_ID=CAMNT_0043311645 /DNA_START=127 /DNA_END=606 /DNA_ORIENTATION=+
MKSPEYTLDKGEVCHHEDLLRILAQANSIRCNRNSLILPSSEDDPAHHEASQLNSLGLYFSVVRKDLRRALVCHMHALKIIWAVIPATEESLVEGALTRLDIARVLDTLGNEEDARRFILEARAILAPLGQAAITQVLLSYGQQRQCPAEACRNAKEQQ